MRVIEKMERGREIEPATSSLGIQQETGNKEFSVSAHLVLAIKIAVFLPCAFPPLLTEHKRSTRNRHDPECHCFELAACGSFPCLRPH
jgi:hypothetical protein